MFCKNCGSPTVGNSELCENCKMQQGAGVQAAALTATPAPVPTPVPTPPPVPPTGSANPYAGTAPMGEQSVSSNPQLVTNRGLLKMILLGIVTLGIYPVIAQDKMIHELNIAAFRRDGRITLSMAAIAPLIVITLTIYMFVYYHQYTARLQSELRCRGIAYNVGPVHFWLLNVLFSWTLICPLIFSHKVIRAHNLINADYNQKGF